MKLRELYRRGRNYLLGAGIEGAARDAEVLLYDLVGSDRSILVLKSDSTVSRDVAQIYLNRLRERSRRKPVAYVLGKQEFYGRDFAVNSSVLIPRPETEGLVDLVLGHARKSQRQLHVLDLCSGSGCIGISLAAELPLATVHLSEIDEKAMQVAKQNASALPGDLCRVEFFCGDLYAPLPPDASYDWILCNPPYIYPDEADDLMPDVRDFEPKTALFHENPPELYREILLGARVRLKRGGQIALELGPRLAEPCLRMARQYFGNASLRKDLSGLSRYLIAIKS